MQETLAIIKENALKAYDEGSDKQKSFLENLFGTETFSRNIMDRVKCFADVLRIKGITGEEFAASCRTLEPDEIGYRKYKMLAEVLNEGWKPDFGNDDEYKYSPYMEYTAGSGFAFHGSNFGLANSWVGPRLVFKSRELSNYAGTQFPEIINQFWL